MIDADLCSHLLSERVRAWLFCCNVLSEEKVSAELLRDRPSVALSFPPLSLTMGLYQSLQSVQILAPLLSLSLY